MICYLPCLNTDPSDLKTMIVYCLGTKSFNYGNMFERYVPNPFYIGTNISFFFLIDG